MRIAVVNNWVPFLKGGAEYLATALTNKLIEYGHEATLIRLPFQWNPPEKIEEHILACRCVRIAKVDRVIGLKFPAYYVPHDNKVLWLLHQFRQAYDLWGTALQDLPDSSEGARIRRTVIQSDNHFLPEYRRIYTTSPVTQDRLRRYNNLPSTILFPPLLESAHLTCTGYGDYLFFPSRITAAKRQHMVIEAMQHVKTNVKLVIAGPPDTPSDLKTITDLVSERQLEERVRIIPRFISEEEKAALFSEALACAYTPYDEDSYGYVTLEASHAAKATITCSDSGGVAILVKDGHTGLITDPEPIALAEAMDRLYLDRDHARVLGQAAREHMRSLRISWDCAIEQLTA